MRADLDALFERYPAEEELAKSIPLSRWAKIAFGEGKHYAVGVIRDETRVRYICYGVPAERRGEPPDALKKWCSFLPLSVFDMTERAMDDVPGRGDGRMRSNRHERPARGKSQNHQ